MLEAGYSRLDTRFQILDAKMLLSSKFARRLHFEILNSKC